MNMIDRFWIVVLLLTWGALLFSCGKNPRTRVETFETESGWGYSIVHNDKVFIKQEHVPAVSGNYSFIRESDARNVGSLVLKKLKNQQSPSITIHELDSLKIEYPIMR